jgi:hypothetical protein
MPRLSLFSFTRPTRDRPIRNEEWAHSSSNASDDLGDFNVDVFFEILFGSHIVEPYVGQLKVA